MRIRHPRAHPDVPGKPPARVDTGRDVRELNEDGVFKDSKEFARGLADRFDVPFDVVDASVPVSDVDATGDESDPEDSDESDGGTGTCEAVKSDGEVCGRELPCPYHSGGDE